MSPKPVLTPLSADYYPDVYRLLEANDLPNDDLDEMEITFWGYILNEKVVAAIGLHIFDRVGLLRSLVVHEDHRTQNWGEDLLKELLRHAETLKLQAVYLLTTTAEKYFLNKGFMQISREHVPAEIKSSTQYAELCPDTAEVMYMAFQ